MLELHNVYVDYMDQRALEDINLTVDKGDFLALFGNDDVGKSVMLYAIMGYTGYYDGELKVFGKEVSSLKTADFAKIKFVPDEALVERMLAKKYLDMAAHAAKEYDIELQEKMCKDYCIDLDEPKQYLAKEMWKKLCNDLKSLNEAGTTIIISVDKYEDLDGYCNCYACLRDRRIVAVDNIETDMVYHPAKMVTMIGGNYKPIEEVCIKCVSEKDNIRSYIYDGKMNRLMVAIAKAACSDWTVEKMTFEEELVEDYSRWE